MLDKSQYLARFKVSPTTRDQGLATEIYESLGRRVAFGRIMKIIERTGWQATFDAWKASQREGVKNPVALFLWRVRQSAAGVAFKASSA